MWICEFTKDACRGDGVSVCVFGLHFRRQFTNPYIRKKCVFQDLRRNTQWQLRVIEVSFMVDIWWAQNSSTQSFNYRDIPLWSVCFTQLVSGLSRMFDASNPRKLARCSAASRFACVGGKKKKSERKDSLMLSKVLILCGSFTVNLDWECEEKKQLASLHFVSSEWCYMIVLLPIYRCYGIIFKSFKKFLFLQA